MTVMPPFTKWATIEVGDNLKNLPQSYTDFYGPITDTTINSLKDQLEYINETIFTYLKRSALDSIINESFQDLAISMGVLLVNEGDLENPLKFESVPANDVIIDSTDNLHINNVWRSLTLEVRKIQNIWPDAQLSNELQQMLASNPDNQVKLIEGAITCKPNELGQKYFYFVMDNQGRNIIFEEWRDIFPWLVFRGMKSPGE